MAESSNPYQAPGSNLTGSYSSSHSGVAEAVIDQLKRTKGWVRLMSVLFFIGSAFLILGAVLMLVMGSVGALAGEEGGAELAALGAAGPILIAVIYGGMALLYIYPGVKLWKYGNSISQLMSTRHEADLVAALDQQRGFWKFVGIMAIIVISLYVVGIAMFAVFAGIAAASMQNQ